MAHTRLVVDGALIVDRDAGEWVARMPELEQYLNPSAPPQPWMQAVLILLSQAVMRNQAFAAEVTTRDGGCTIDVDTRW